MAEEVKSKLNLSPLQKGELTGEERRDLLERVKASPESRKRLTAENPSAIFSLLSLQRKEDDFWHDVWPGIRAEISEPSPWRTLVFSSKRFYRPALAACAAVLLAVLGVYVLHDGGQPADWNGIQTVYFNPIETDRFSDVPVLENIEPAEAVVFDMGIIDQDNKTHLVHLTNVDLEL